VCASASSYWHADKWTFIGEWTGAMTDCARYLNGYGTGARYDGTYPGAQNLESRGVGSCAQKSNIALWDEQMKTDTRMYVEAQMDVFEANTEGWFWWNFKTEGAHEWDMFALVDAGIFPQPLTDRRYAPACSSYS
jgi:glucan 1,3-beta-glucosidase